MASSQNTHALRAGFAEVDITPPIGSEQVGWLARVVIERILDPIFAKIAVFECGGRQVGFVSLDTLSVRWTQVDEIRARVEQEIGIPGRGIMVAATHNHAGAAVASIGEVRRDDTYLAFMVDQIVRGFAAAKQAMVPAKIGVASGFEGRVSFNRRYIMRDGSAKCQPAPADPNTLCVEGPIDSEVGVVCARDLRDKPLGFLVNFALHPTHRGGSGTVSAGYPGVLSTEIKSKVGDDCAVLFLNGACGNIHSTSRVDPDYVDTAERIGAVLAEDVLKIVEGMSFVTEVALDSGSATLQLPLREVSESDIEPAPRSQRYARDEIYRDSVLRLIERRRTRDFAMAEVQAIRVGNTVFAAIPAEYFVELGLRIKLDSAADRTYVVSCANGMVGYVPHAAAFERGGYETTIAEWSKLAPEAGDMLADAALRVISEVKAS